MSPPSVPQHPSHKINYERSVKTHKKGKELVLHGQAAMSSIRGPNNLRMLRIICFSLVFMFVLRDALVNTKFVIITHQDNEINTP